MPTSSRWHAWSAPRTLATTLITGVTGQDGVLLARRLLARGDRVLGTCRSGEAGELAPLLEGVELVAHDVRDTDGFAHILEEHRPDGVVNLAALTSVGASWDHPDIAHEVNQTAVLAMLEVLGALSAPPRFVQASSSEIFGPPDRIGALTDENTALNPQSPYAEAKAAAHEAVRDARGAGLPATNLILFGHTGPLQAPTFVIPTIARQAALVGAGQADELVLQDPTICRDWGCADDVALAFEAALGGPTGDYVIATGELHMLADVADWALTAAGSAIKAQAAVDAPTRPNDFGGRAGDITRAREALDWAPVCNLRAEVEHMVAVEARRLRTGLRYSTTDLT